MKTRFYAYALKATFLLGLLIATPLCAAELNRNSTLDDTIAPQDMINDAPGFDTVIDDLPLMPGLQVMQDRDVLFFEPKAGRIAETTAEGAVDIDDVYDFYKRSLPHLGWKMVDARDYIREKELLRIDAHADQKITTVRFSIKPTSTQN